MSSPAREIIEVVLKRATILQYICEEQPTKRDLVDSAPDSRPTIDRAIRELEEYQLVRRKDGVCQPTYTGKMAYELCQEYKNSFDALEKADVEVSALPLDAGLSKAVFHTGSVFQPPEHAPYEKIKPMYEDFTNGDTLSGVTRVLIPPYINQILARSARGALDVELVIDSGALDILLETQEETALKCIESGDTIYKVNGLSQYSVFLIDSEILYVTLYSDTNHLSAVIRNTSCGAIRWAENHIADFKNEASLLTA